VKNPDEKESDYAFDSNLLFFKGLYRTILKDSLAAELSAFEQHYSLNGQGVSMAFAGDAEAVFVSFANSRDFFANQYMTILIKYILRFIGGKIDFSRSMGKFSHSAERMMVQKIVTNDTRYFIGISGEKKTLHKLNAALKNSFASGGSIFYDSLSTFLNCVSCIFQSFVEKEKQILLIDSPHIYKYSTVKANENFTLLPITVGDMKLGLLVGYGNKPNFATISHNI